MNMPRKLRIGPHVYSVRLNKDGALAAAERSGQTRYGELVIDIAAGQAPSQLADTLLHETLHATLAPFHLADEFEENLVRFLAPALLDVLRSNPQLIGFLFTSK